MTTSEDHLRTAVASHSHLFPGALLRVDMGEIEGEPAFEPQAMRILFSDGSSSNAELVVVLDDCEGEAALIVERYTTAAGTALPQKTWRVAEHGFEGSALGLRVGQALPFTD